MKTYRDLLTALQELTPAQLDSQVSILTLLPEKEFSLHNVSDTVMAGDTSQYGTKEFQDEVVDACDGEEMHPVLVVDESD